MTTYKVKYNKVWIPSDKGATLTANQRARVEDLLQNAGVQEYLQSIGWSWVDDDVETNVDYYDV